MLDNSVGKPGPMGWGEEFITDQARLDEEMRLLEQAQERVPACFVPRAAKPVNKKMLERLIAVQQEDGIEEGVSLLHLEKAVFGDFLVWLMQLIGSCVASGGGRVTTKRSIAEVHLLNETEQPFGVNLTSIFNLCPFLPFAYRAGRAIAGINGNSDGSYCSAHMEGKIRYGNLQCSTPGIKSDAYPEPQSKTLYRQYGANNSILTEFSEQAAVYKLLETGKITDIDEAKKRMEEFKPFQICSNWAFAPKEKHPTWKLSDGSPVYIYTRNTRDSWAHNMSVVGIVRVGNEWFVIIENSWGMSAHRNGSWFAITLAEFGKWLKSAECMYEGDIDLPDNTNPALAA